MAKIAERRVSCSVVKPNNLILSYLSGQHPLALSLARPSAASMQTTRVLSRRPASARRSPGASLPTLSWRGRTRLSPRARSASSWRACRWTSSCASTTTSSWPPLTRWTPRTMNELPRANKYVHPKVHAVRTTHETGPRGADHVVTLNPEPYW